MGKPYSLDLRERICAYVAEGNSACSAGRLFGVSAATAVRLAADHREHGTAAPKPVLSDKLALRRGRAPASVRS